jgi:adenylate cyclase
LDDCRPSFLGNAYPAEVIPAELPSTFLSNLSEGDASGGSRIGLLIRANGGDDHRAAALLDQAIARDPLYGPALGTAAVIRVQMEPAGIADDPVRNQAEAIALARRGLEAAPDDPTVLRCAGFALGYFGEDIATAITLVDRSLDLNPNNARAWRSSGILRIYAGDLDPAIEHLEKSIRLDPRANMSVPLGTIGIAHFFAGRFELALPKFLAAIQQMPSYRTPYRFLTACYAHLGRLTEAREILAKLRNMGAESEPRVAHWRNPEHRELLMSGLRLAAGETP